MSRGAGKPLIRDDDRHMPPELRDGYHLLKKAGVMPPEIEAQRAIRDERARLDAPARPRSADPERPTRRLRWLGTARKRLCQPPPWPIDGDGFALGGAGSARLPAGGPGSG